MRYDEALSWLYDRQRFGIKQGLENMQTLLAALDHPERAFPTFHVTGSNGKGSVCAFLDEALRAGGHRVARYVSPHLTSFTERITMDGKEIPRADVALVTEQIRPTVEDLEARGVKPTFFEVVTAAAFQYFRRRRADVAVVEVGMGGRWDATNVVEPVACAITPIGLEHTDRLGSTIAQIAAEKAGILKRGVPAVTRATGDAYDVIRRRARELEAPLGFVGAPPAQESLEATVTTINYAAESIAMRLGLLGRHQAENAALAAASLEAGPERFRPAADQLKVGFERLRWPGRLEPVSRHPLVLADGAHNAPACQVLGGFLERVVRPRRTGILFAALRDKNVPVMVRHLRDACDRWVVTTAPTPRAIPASELAGSLARDGITAEIVDDNVEAIRALHRDADRGDVLVVTGSLFLVGAARAALLKAETDPPLAHARLQ